jgi:hypothetical protein
VIGIEVVLGINERARAAVDRHGLLAGINIMPPGRDVTGSDLLEQAPNVVGDFGAALPDQRHTV